MEPSVILHSTSLKDFQSIIGDIIEEKLRSYKQESQSNHNADPEYLTRREVCKLLKISLATLHYYTKDGTLQGYRIGGRVLYKTAEVQNAVKEIQSNKYKRRA